MRIEHHGAVNGVTGSCHQLFIDDKHSVLIDCGIFQGEEYSEGGASFNHLAIDFDVMHIHALLITHCHIDHVGRIPYLLAAGFNGPIYCSEPTALLLPIVLEDAMKIGITRDDRLVSKFLKVIQQIIVPVAYKEWIEIPIPDTRVHLKVRFKQAGHILGSAYIECHLKEERDAYKVLFSGDLGAPYTPLLPSPKPPWSTDILIMESTYGDRRHEGRRDRDRLLRKIIERAFRDRGTLLIPAFSIGRTQELLYELEQIIKRFGDRKASERLKWEDIDVVVDSPLASRFTDKYIALRSYWDKEAKRLLRSGRHPLSFEQMITIDDHPSHLNTLSYLKRSGRPAIVIAASGMCTGGRIVNYLKALISDPKTDILFIGYQAEGTPGRIIQRYGPRNGYVYLDGTQYTIHASIHTLSGFSAHGDQRNLINFVKGMRKKPKEIRLVHGSKEAKVALKKKLTSKFPEIQVTLPSR